MKKITNSIIALFLAFSMVGCAQKTSQEPAEAKDEQTTEVEATPEAADETVKDEVKMTAQGAWVVQTDEVIDYETEDAERLTRAISDRTVNLVDILATKEDESGKEYLYLIYETAEDGTRTWSIADVLETKEGDISLSAAFPIDLATIDFVAPADKNIPEHAELAEEGWVYNTGRQAKFTTEEFEKLAADLFEKNGLSYEPEVFLAEAVTGSGFVIIARHVNEDGTTKDMHIVEIARSGNFDENGPEDEFDVTKDDVIRPADYTLSLDEAGSETQEKVVETTIPAENN